MFDKFIDEYGFIDEQGAVDLLESIVPISTLNQCTRIWGDCPDMQYSRNKYGEQYAFSEISEIFRKKANGYRVKYEHISAFIAYQKAHTVSKIAQGRKLLLTPPPDPYGPVVDEFID
jgi:hypothetical protein